MAVTPFLVQQQKHSISHSIGGTVIVAVPSFSPLQGLRYKERNIIARTKFHLNIVLIGVNCLVIIPVTFAIITLLSAFVQSVILALWDDL